MAGGGSNLCSSNTQCIMCQSPKASVVRHPKHQLGIPLWTRLFMCLLLIKQAQVAFVQPCCSSMGIFTDNNPCTLTNLLATACIIEPQYSQ